MLLPIQYIWSCIICWSVSSIGEMQPRKVISGTWIRDVCCEWWQVHGHVCRTWGCWHYPEWTPISSQTSKDFAVLPERVQEHLPGPVVMIFLELLLRPVFMSLTNPPAHGTVSSGLFYCSCIFFIIPILIYLWWHKLLLASNSLLTMSVPLDVCSASTLILLVLDDSNKTVGLSPTLCTDPAQLRTNIFR